MRVPFGQSAALLVLPTFALALFGAEAMGGGAPAPTLGKLAAAMQPGQWQELRSAGYAQDTLMRGDDILAYAGRAAWDHRSQQALFIGQVHLKGPPVFIAYSVQDNRWRRMPPPSWAAKLKWFHAYENNAADATAGIFYHHQSDSRRIHRYDVEKDQWSTLPELDAPTGHGTAIEFFPEMNALVRVHQGTVWSYAEKKGTWSRLADKLAMGLYHNFAAYSPRFKAVFFGGGNDSGAIYVLRADGTIRPGAKAPVDLGIGRSLNVVDPVSGELLVLAKGGRFLAYNAGKDAWRELPTTNLPFTRYAGHSVSAAPISNHGVVLFFSSQPQGMKTYLYRHAE